MPIAENLLAPMELTFRCGTRDEANQLLSGLHYLGPSRRGQFAIIGEAGGAVVACQIWQTPPTSKALPNDGTWLELTRWCLTPEAGANAGSRQHAFAIRWLRRELPLVTTIVSYSDPSVGHTGALYKACNWRYAPTWHRLFPPPTGGGSWDGVKQQAPKDRWWFPVQRRDDRRSGIFAVKDGRAA